MGQQILAFAGAAVGAYFGGPLGAELGFAIGGALGGALFPKHLDGPHSKPLQPQTSQYGAMLPIVKGNARVPGNVIWQEDIDLVGSSQGGKGGPSVTTYSAFGTFATALCEGPITGIRRIWANGVLVYDVSSSATATTVQASNTFAANHLTIYLGTATQNPDPTMQAALGAGNVPGYRGTAYVVFRAVPLENFGNLIPSINVEVFTTPGTPTMTQLWENDAVGFPVSYNVYGTPTAGLYAPYISTISPTIRVFDRAMPTTGSPLSSTHTVAILDPATGLYQGSDNDASSALETGFPNFAPYLNITLFGNFVPVWRGVACDPTGSFFIAWTIPLGFYTFTGTTSGAGKVSIGSVSTALGITFDDVVARLTPGGTSWSLVGIIPCANRNYFLVMTQDTAHSYAHVCSLDSSTGLTAEVTRYVLPQSAFNPAPFLFKIFGSLGNDIYGQGGMLESDLQHFWTVQATGVPYSPQATLTQFQLTNSGLVLVGTTTSAWQSTAQSKQYTSIWADGGVAFLVVGNNATAWTIGVPTVETTLSSIVSDICERSGLQAGQINVTALTDQVWGFVIDRQMSGRQALESISPAWWFDAVESDGVLKFVHRSATPLATITLDDMGADTAGKVSTAPLSFTRGSEIELPTQIDLHYYAIGAAYQSGVQYGRRLVGIESDNIQSVDTAAVMDDTQAAVAADIVMWDTIAGRVSFKFSTSYKWAQYEPTDILNLQTTNETYPVRFTRKSESAGKIDWEAVACAPVYSQAASGGAITSSQTVTGPLPTTAVIMDIAPLRDQDGATSNLYVAMYGATGWHGGTLYKSSDGGATFVAGISMGSFSTVGSAITALPNWTGGNIFDEGNSVDVGITSAPTSTPLSSASELTVLNGGNVALLGNEILQFKNATLISTDRYRLSGLLRGRFSTEWAMSGHGIGDRFVLLTGNVGLQVTPTSDIGQPRIYQAVTSNQPLGSGAQQTITEQGRTLICFSPVLLFGTNDGSPGDIRLRWTRRNRITWQWLESVDVPMSEASEAYVVSIFNAAGTVVLRTINVSGTGVQNATYTSAQQTTDFGAPLAKGASLIWGVQQISAVTGPGIMAKITSIMPGSEGVTITSHAGSTASVGKVISKIVTATAPSSASLSTGDVHSLTMSYPQPQSASLARSVGKLISLSQSVSLALPKSAGKLLSVSQSSAASLATSFISGSAGSVLQTVKLFEDMSGTSNGTLSGTLSGVTAGSTIVVFFGNHSGTGSPACSDGQGSYTLDFDSGSGVNNRGIAFHLTGANAGSHTISITNCKTFCVAWAVEITAAASSSFDAGHEQHTGQGTGTDGVTSGNFTTTQANDLILGFCYSSVSTVSTGTGFTSQGSSTGSGQFGTRVESKVASSIGTYAVTFTTGTALDAAIGCAFKHP